MFLLQLAKNQENHTFFNFFQTYFTDRLFFIQKEK